jgi:hypothetical protein
MTPDHPDETRPSATRPSGPPDHMEQPGRGTESGARHGADSDGDPADASIPGGDGTAEDAPGSPRDSTEVDEEDATGDAGHRP